MKNMTGKTSDFHKAKIAQLMSCEVGQNKSIKYNISLFSNLHSLFIT